MFKKKKKKTSKYQKYELSSSRKVEQQLREARLLPAQRRLRFPPRGAAGNGAAQRGSASAEAVPAPAQRWRCHFASLPASIPRGDAFFHKGFGGFPLLPPRFQGEEGKRVFLAVPFEYRFSLCWETVVPARRGAALAEDTPQTGQ